MYCSIEDGQVCSFVSSEELEEWKAEAGDFEVIIRKSSDPKDALLKARFNALKTFSWTGL